MHKHLAVMRIPQYHGEHHNTLAAQNAMGKKIYLNNGTQADRIINRFQGARILAAAIRQATGDKCDPSRVFRWRIPKEKGGTDGLIPTSAVLQVKAAARLMGILIPDDDWVPRALIPNQDFSPDPAPQTKEAA